MPSHAQTSSPWRYDHMESCCGSYRKYRIMRFQRSDDGPEQCAPRSELTLLFSIEAGKPWNVETWKLTMAELVSSHCRPISVQGVWGPKAAAATAS